MKKVAISETPRKFGFLGKLEELKEFSIQEGLEVCTFQQDGKLLVWEVVHYRKDSVIRVLSSFDREDQFWDAFFPF